MEHFFESSTIMISGVIALITLYLLKKVIDANKTKKEEIEVTEEIKIEETVEDTDAEEVIEEEPKEEELPEEVVAAIVAALAAMGYPKAKIASIRPRKNKQWKLEGRMHKTM